VPELPASVGDVQMFIVIVAEEDEYRPSEGLSASRVAATA